MENNIFEGAKFGDKFLTRDGCIALYLGKTNDMDFHVLTFVEDGFRYEEHYIDNGRLKYSKYQGTENDIVSRYQGPIDEGELTELSLEDVPNYCYEQDGDFLKDTWIEGFKAGYQKAIEE